MPVGKPTDPTVDRIAVYPGERVLDARQRPADRRHRDYTDGTTEDVTRWAQYQSNETEVAAVEEGGRVETRRLSGQAAIMARYQGQVAVFRATVPLEHGASRQRRIPRPECDRRRGAQAVEGPGHRPLGALHRRRVHPPGVARHHRHLAAAPTRSSRSSPIGDPDKRAKLVDRLLDRPEYASFFAIKWADILRNKREGRSDVQSSTFNFHDWIRESLAQQRALRPVRPRRSWPPAEARRPRRRSSGIASCARPSAFVDDTAQVFLGMRLQCAKCHHHPFEKWSQDDYYGFAAFFARVGRKPDMKAQRSGRDAEVIYTLRSGTVSHPKTGETDGAQGTGRERGAGRRGRRPAAEAGRLDGRRQEPVLRQGARESLLGPLLRPRDRRAARRHAADQPAVEPRAARRPGRDVRQERLRPEGPGPRRSARAGSTGFRACPTRSNAKDKQSFARHYPRRMGAEVLLDAIAQVSGVPTPFDGLPAGTRAIDLPDESVGSTFLDAFGRPKRETSCECERVTDASLSQSLMLLNSGEVQAKLSSPGSRAEQLAKDPRPDAQKIDELFWAAFARGATKQETASALAHLTKHAANRADGLRRHHLGTRSTPRSFSLSIDVSGQLSVVSCRSSAGRILVREPLDARAHGILGRRANGVQPAGLPESRLPGGDRADAWELAAGARDCRRRSSAGRAARPLGDPDLARRRAAPARDVRPQARRSGRVSRAAQGDLDGRSRRAGLRAACRSTPG